MFRKAVALLALVIASTASAQWQTPGRDVTIKTNSLGYIPTSMSNVQLVVDWIDDTFGVPYTNVFTYLPSVTTNINGLWPFMTNVDNALATRWTNNFDRLPDVTTNLFGIWPFLTNVDVVLSADSNSIATLSTGKTDLVTFNRLFTNDFNVLPDITTNIAGLWPFMTNVDNRLALIATNSSLDAQPYASFVYATDFEGSVTGAQDISTAWTPITTNSGLGYRRQVVTNGFSHVVTGSDNYWVVPSNGLYTLHNTLGYLMYNQGSLDSWVTANGATSSAVSNGAARTFHQDYQNYIGLVSTNLGVFHKHSGSAIFYWTAGTTVRVEAATANAANSARVSYVSVDIRRIGAP